MADVEKMVDLDKLERAARAATPYGRMIGEPGVDTVSGKTTRTLKNDYGVILGELDVWTGDWAEESRANAEFYELLDPPTVLALIERGKVLSADIDSAHKLGRFLIQCAELERDGWKARAEAAEERVKVLEEALEPFANVAKHLTSSVYGPAWGFNDAVIEHEDFRRALSALPNATGGEGYGSSRTESGGTASPKSDGLCKSEGDAARWRCTRCGRDEIDARANSCERGPCPMEFVG